MALRWFCTLCERIMRHDDKSCTHKCGRRCDDGKSDGYCVVVDVLEITDDSEDK